MEQFFYWIGKTLRRKMKNCKSSLGQNITIDLRLACEQALWGTLAAGRGKEGELASTSLKLNSTSNSLVAPGDCQISANQHEAETSEKQTLKTTCQG